MKTLVNGNGKFVDGKIVNLPGDLVNGYRALMMGLADLSGLLS